MTNPAPRISIDQRFAEFTPIICRLLARVGVGRAVRPMTDKEIAKAAKLNTFQVMSLSMLPCWDEVPVLTALKFMNGCGIILHDGTIMHNHSSYIKRYGKRWDYLRKTPEWKMRWSKMIEIQRRYYE